MDKNRGTVLGTVLHERIKNPVNYSKRRLFFHNLDKEKEKKPARKEAGDKPKKEQGAAQKKVKKEEDSKDAPQD